MLISRMRDDRHEPAWSPSLAKVVIGHELQQQSRTILISSVRNDARDDSAS